MPIAAAQLRIADQEHSTKTPAEAREARFRVNLPRGQTQLHDWFQDAAGKDLCGAFFATVTKRDR